MKISANKFVACSYELYAGPGDERELKERATKDAPMTYVHGMNMMLPAFEEKMMGLGAGEKFDFELDIDDAYGERIPEAMQELPKEIFKNGEGKFDEDVVFVGNYVPMMDSEGHQFQGLVCEVKDDKVIMDFNHPLAGMKLHFIGEVLDVHEATPEEMKKIFGGGCGCGCGCHSEDENEGEGGCGCHSGGGCGCHDNDGGCGCH